MKDVISRLTSRKFWLAVSGFIFCVANNDTTGAIAVVLGYLGVEGATDFKSAK